MFDVNSSILFWFAGVVILFVLIQSVFFLIKALKRAKELNMSKKKIKQIISGAAIFTVAPAISIILGMISLSKFLGLPLPWLRLSVLGALTYELTAASTAASVLDIPLDQPIADAAAYTTISWVMALGIISGIVVIALFLPKMQKNLIKMKSKDEKWSKLLIDALFMGMISAFLGMIFSEIRFGLKGWIPVFVMFFSALLMLICGLIVKKTSAKWLESYAMPISLLGGMAFSIPITMLIV
ncbi:DUF5058 family protein [Treponema putidum]|uniref:DUF5058 family protein n=1 Tax=Treponema putidum TaxID=221027 RepID=A0ABY5HX09_9SPIR|nr:DUF5058 family protein [Treponema putidum]AIN93720.1 membrane protein [Treponema putidum]TWI77822.1 uncharacterized protein DUF5058 [Treponema putidum]UTY29966.1 DUF5058 family protein [Treponema putidum]UTY32431.1 DUF5058 family protein [Treponema putidum]